MARIFAIGCTTSQVEQIRNLCGDQEIVVLSVPDTLFDEEEVADQLVDKLCFDHNGCFADLHILGGSDEFRYEMNFHLKDILGISSVYDIERFLTMAKKDDRHEKLQKRNPQRNIPSYLQ